jgi:hypothetical protein
MESEKPRKIYGRGTNITKTRELAKELRDAVKLTVESWAASVKERLQGQGYESTIVEAAIEKTTDAAYDRLTWKTLHKGEGYNDPHHERELAAFLAEHPDGEVTETRVGFRHFRYGVFKASDIDRMFNHDIDIPPLSGSDD